MGILESSLERRIRFELAAVNQKLRDIGSGKEKNHYVSAPRYLRPKITETVLPENHLKGEAAYYLKIRGALETALETGKIPSYPYKPLLENAPSDIRCLLDPPDEFDEE